MKTLASYQKIENPKNFIRERKMIKDAFNMQILEIHGKIKLEAEMNNKKVFYSIPINSVVFSGNDDREAYLNKTFSALGPFQINRVDVVYYEYLHDHGRSESGIYFYFNLNKIDKYSSDIKISEEDSHFIEIPVDNLRFCDDEMRIYYWRKNIYFLAKKEYCFCKEIILEIYSELELNQNNKNS